MSENEDFESLKVTELQNELKKRGLDTKGRKADLIIRLREAINNGIEVADSEQNDEESSSPSSPIQDDDEEEAEDNNVQEQSQPQPMDETLPPVDPPPEQTESTLSKKRSLDEDENQENDPNPPEENDNDDPEKLSRKKKSRWGNEEESEEKQSVIKLPTSDEEDNSSSTNRDRDYHRSSSKYDDDRSYNNRRLERSPEKEIPLPEEETVQFNPDDVVLDFYTSDLNLTINTDCLSATTKSNDALCFLWAGARTTYGFKQGKICYEIRVAEILDCPDMPDNEKEKSGIRIGWSNLSSNHHALQLGEINDSFAYTSTGTKLSKLSERSSEESYGEPFSQSDIIGCYIDFGENENDNFIRISFTKNGQDYGQAFEIDKNQSVFYPHILVKNVKFECNFGQLESPWSEMKSDYVFPQAVPLADRIRSVEPIIEKSDCQVVFVSGLTCSGKTTWANKYVQDNPTKHFQLINVESVLNQMTIDGKLPYIKDRNDGTMLRVNVCLQKLIEIASQRRRNFIIDHVNTTREIQSKRQRLFTGYHRIGVVIVPDDEEYRKRIEKVEKLENINIPSQWIRDAKSRFYFLQTSSTLEDVIYPELSYDDAKSLFEKARRDSEQYRSSSSRYDRHDDYRSSRHERNRYDDRDRDRDRYDRRDRSRSRERRSRERDRDRDRRGPRDDSRYSSSSRRNDNYGGGGGGGHNSNNNNYRGGGGYSRGGGGYSDYRQDSRNNNNYNQRGGGGGSFHGRGGSNNNQSNDNWRGGYHQQQRNDFGGRGRGGNQFNNRGSYQDNQRSGGDGGFRSDFNHQQRNRQFNDFDNNPQHQATSSGFMQNNNNNNNNNFNQQNDRQGFGTRPSIPQQQNQYQNQQRPQPLLQTPPSTQQQFGTQQPPANNPNLSLQTQNPLGINPAGVNQSNSLDSWFALCAAALNPQTAAAATTTATTPTQPQTDVNALSQQWSQWLKTAQLTQQQQQQQAQPQINIQPTESQASAIPDATALYYQAYYAQLAAAQQQAAAAAAAAASQNNNDK